MVDTLQFRLLQRVAPKRPPFHSDRIYREKGKMLQLFGEAVLEQFRGKVVIDFGCGQGRESIDIALHGARKVIGIDIRESTLESARKRAAENGVGHICEFCFDTTELADVVISIDAFEHYLDPAATLRQLHGMLKPGGCLLATMSGTWYNPLGGHIFSIFPWSHLLFSDAPLFRWRSWLVGDGARTYEEVGMNRMTIGRFERLLREGPFEIEWLKLIPSRKLRLLHNRLTREFTTGAVQCKLVKRPQK